MTRQLDIRKRQVVSDAIQDAAIALFAKKGFDATTVDDIAERVAISQRTFFRYFESKDDLLAINVVRYGAVLCEAVTSSPADLECARVVQRAVVAGVKFSSSSARTRRLIEISEHSPAARQAHLSRMREVEDLLTKAFAARTASGSKSFLTNRLLALVTLTIMHAAVFSWFNGEYKNLEAAAQAAFQSIQRIFGDESNTTGKDGEYSRSRRLGRNAANKTRLSRR